VNRNDTRCWKAGLFYYNREDPDLLVPKRVGKGRTLNMARRMSWVIIGAPMVAVGVLRALTTPGFVQR
jgi:uncharacterized membrane protein